MPKPHNRSTTKRKLIRKTTNKTKRVYKRRVKKAKAKDTISKKKLQAVSHKGSLTQKRPSRPYSGVLSHKTLETVLKLAQRVKSKKLKIEDVEIRYLPYVKNLVKRL